MEPVDKNANAQHYIIRLSTLGVQKVNIMISCGMRPIVIARFHFAKIFRSFQIRCQFYITNYTCGDTRLQKWVVTFGHPVSLI